METATQSVFWSGLLEKGKKQWRTLLHKRRCALILAVAFVCLIALAVVLLQPVASKAGAVSVRANETVTKIPGVEVFRLFDGRANQTTDESVEQLETVPCIVGSGNMEILLDGMLFEDKAYVSVYNAEQEPISLNQERLTVPAEAGKYLVRVEAFWGEKANLVATAHYLWLEVPEV